MISHRFNYAINTEAQTSSYEILSCEAPAPQPSTPCGTFVTYDPINDKNAPARNGFVAGTYVDASKVYVGLGDNTVCFGETMAPCRLNINDPAGCYIAGCAVQKFENKKVKYLLNHPNLKWVPVTSATVFSTNGLSYDIPGVGTLKFARVNSTSRGINYVTIGKAIHYSNGNPSFHGAFW
jgi:hypothetical protein